MHTYPAQLHVLDLIAPILVACVYISACSLFKEPNRRNFNAIMIAGAGAAYLGGGFQVADVRFHASEVGPAGDEMSGGPARAVYRR